MSIKTVMFDLDGTLLPMHIYTLPIPLSSVSSWHPTDASFY